MAVTARGRRLLRAFIGLTCIAGFGALAVGGVVALLHRIDGPRAAASGCTADGQWLALDQSANAALIAGLSTQRELPARAATIALATAIQESKLRNLDYGDRDSLGLFQQRPSQGWGTAEQVTDPVYATSIFYDRLVTVPQYTEIPVTEAAQAVQRSAFPNAYADHESTARAFSSALTGWSSAALACTMAPATVDPSAVGPAVTARLERDLGLTARPAAEPDGVLVDLTRLGLEDAELERATWSVAQAALASANETGAGRIAVGNYVWERVSGEPGWRTLAPKEPTQLRGHILITP